MQLLLQGICLPFSATILKSAHCLWPTAENQQNMLQNSFLKQQKTFFFRQQNSVYFGNYSSENHFVYILYKSLQNRLHSSFGHQNSRAPAFLYRKQFWSNTKFWQSFRTVSLFLLQYGILALLPVVTAVHCKSWLYCVAQQIFEGGLTINTLMYQSAVNCHDILLAQTSCVSWWLSTATHFC